MGRSLGRGAGRVAPLVESPDAATADRQWPLGRRAVEIEFDWTGALAERAFAKKLDAPWAPLHHPDRYHSNHDVAGWHVKGTRHAIDPEHPDKPRLQQPLTADPDGRYVLLSGWTGLADLTDWTIVGWGIGRELFDKRWITTHLHGPPCYWIPHHALRDWPPHFLQTAGLHP